MKRATTRRRKPARGNVLHVRVFSPRLAWIGILRLLGATAKAAFILAVLGGVAWGVWRGVHHAFYQNPDFHLAVIDLNPNPVIDEIGVASVAGIPLATRPSLFEIDIAETERRLRDQHHILEARVERHLPATLVVRIVPRHPKAWLRLPDETIHRRAGELLVDERGVAYPCPPLQAAAASHLPVIEIPRCPENPITPGTKPARPELGHCLALLEAARQADSQAVRWIESIRQANDWSLELLTRDGTRATFSLGDHPRQLGSLRDALDHAADRGYAIETINLIPKHNVPVTLRGGQAPPRAIPVAAEPDRNSRDLRALLDR